jgi:hypothetical protein
MEIEVTEGMKIECLESAAHRGLMFSQGESYEAIKRLGTLHILHPEDFDRSRLWDIEHDEQDEKHFGIKQKSGVTMKDLPISMLP